MPKQGKEGNAMKNNKIIQRFSTCILALTLAMMLQGCRENEPASDTTAPDAEAGGAQEKPAAADGPTMQKPQNKEKVVELVKDEIDDQADEKLQDKRTKIIEEAVAAIGETENALAALEESKPDDALAALERATGKLELILAREPGLALAPVDVHLTTRDVYATLEAIEEAREEAEELLDDGEVQRARSLLAGLVSEFVVSVTNLPLGSYPEAIKAVTPLIDKGETDKAKDALRTALATLVVTHHVTPLPVVRAEEILKSARELSEKKERTDKENKDLRGYIENARYQLKMAEALGYGKSEDFEEFYEQLDEIEKKTGGGKSGEGFFAKIEKSLSDFKRKVFE
jgi:tetratricopeptide (TPR) repeat protein